MDVTVAKQLDCYAIEDIYNLPDGQRTELIDSELYMIATPNRIHRKLVHLFDWTIENYIHNKNETCEVYPSLFAVYLNADNEIYRLYVIKISSQTKDTRAHQIGL